ncbi:hypothetical protein GF339_06685 [candidate division KSB3 bacterium]|uniref:Uncharacterized protein n=1 Tax=candidate division KSB3 bacterium TaxID=2044937 RepID=A0A9D5Q5E8_9BACT|nr:hypothetical protein [candidate division KSB3 bacterium]MBD3324253.1 hypothetical protein [candidate division KSB3 bacterium]
MLNSIEGIYRDGKIELLEPPRDVKNNTYVIVTFLQSGAIDLQARGIDRAHAANLRERLSTFAEEWNSPEMAIYDDYDNAKAHL